MAEPELSPSDLVFAHRDLLPQLAYRERRVLELLYGEDPRPLSDVGSVFNVSEDRVREVSLRALEKVRALAVQHDWREATAVVRYQNGAPLDLNVPLTAVEYARGYGPDGTEARYYCPPTPVGFTLGVDNKRKLWRHQPLASPGQDQAVELGEA